MKMSNWLVFAFLVLLFCTAYAKITPDLTVQTYGGELGLTIDDEEEFIADSATGLERAQQISEAAIAGIMAKNFIVNAAAVTEVSAELVKDLTALEKTRIDRLAGAKLGSLVDAHYASGIVTASQSGAAIDIEHYRGLYNELKAIKNNPSLDPAVRAKAKSIIGTKTNTAKGLARFFEGSANSADIGLDILNEFKVQNMLKTPPAATLRGPADTFTAFATDELARLGAEMDQILTTPKHATEINRGKWVIRGPAQGYKIMSESGEVFVEFVQSVDSLADVQAAASSHQFAALADTAIVGERVFQAKQLIILRRMGTAAKHFRDLENALSAGKTSKVKKASNKLTAEVNRLRNYLLKNGFDPSKIDDFLHFDSAANKLRFAKKNIKTAAELDHVLDTIRVSANVVEAGKLGKLASLTQKVKNSRVGQGAARGWDWLAKSKAGRLVGWAGRTSVGKVVVKFSEAAASLPVQAFLASFRVGMFGNCGLRDDLADLIPPVGNLRVNGGLIEFSAQSNNQRIRSCVENYFGDTKTGHFVLEAVEFIDISALVEDIVYWMGIEGDIMNGCQMIIYSNTKSGTPSTMDYVCYDSPSLKEVGTNLNFEPPLADGQYVAYAFASLTPKGVKYLNELTTEHNVVLVRNPSICNNDQECPLDGGYIVDVLQFSSEGGIVTEGWDDAPVPDGAPGDPVVGLRVSNLDKLKDKTGYTIYDIIESIQVVNNDGEIVAMKANGKIEAEPHNSNIVIILGLKKGETYNINITGKFKNKTLRSYTVK